MLIKRRDLVPGASTGQERRIEGSATASATPGAPAQGHISARFLSDSYVFRWPDATFRTDLPFIVPIALCLAIGLLSGHAAAGMIAAGGAMTTGFGSKHEIDHSILMPMMLCALGISLSTFVGMVAGHEGFGLVLIAAAFGFGYGMLSARAAGFSWVGQQCTVMMLVASAFPFGVRDAAVRSALVLAGGLIQVLCSAVLLRLLHELRGNVRALGRYAREEERALRATYSEAYAILRTGRLDQSPLPYALRVAAVLAVSTWVYRQTHFASGYWIPMTALLVLRPGLSDTANRAIARTVGTLAGAVLASMCLAYTHPVPVALAGFTVLFAWLSYSTLSVNYALFSICLTSYIVMLLSLNGVPGTEIARRRAICTVLGGGMALAVRLVVIHHRQAIAAQKSSPPAAAKTASS